MKTENIPSVLNELGLSEKVTKALMSEREYQDRIWNEDTTETGGKNSDAEFLVFIDDYLREAITIVSRNSEPKASLMASENVRKIAAMVIATADINGWDEYLIMALNEGYKEVAKSRKTDLKLTVPETLAIIKANVNKAYNVIPYAKFSPENDEHKLNLVGVLLFALLSMEDNYAPLRNPPEGGNKH